MPCGGVEILLVAVDVSVNDRSRSLKLPLSVVQDVTCTSSIGGGVQASSNIHLAATTSRLKLEVLLCFAEAWLRWLLLL